MEGYYEGGMLHNMNLVDWARLVWRRDRKTRRQVQQKAPSLALQDSYYCGCPLVRRSYGAALSHQKTCLSLQNSNRGERLLRIALLAAIDHVALSSSASAAVRL